MEILLSGKVSGNVRDKSLTSQKHHFVTTLKLHQKELSPLHNDFKAESHSEECLRIII